MEEIKFEKSIEVNQRTNWFNDLLLPKNDSQNCRQQDMLTWYEDKMRSQRLPWSENVYKPDFGYRIQPQDPDSEIQSCVEAMKHMEQVNYFFFVHFPFRQINCC